MENGNRISSTKLSFSTHHTNKKTYVTQNNIVEVLANHGREKTTEGKIQKDPFFINEISLQISHPPFSRSIQVCHCSLAKKKEYQHRHLVAKSEKISLLIAAPSLHAIFSSCLLECMKFSFSNSDRHDHSSV